MINVRKGTAHSLQQTDVVGAVTVNASRTLGLTTSGGATVVAGMLCQKNSSGNIELIDTCVTTASYGQVGFAVNASADGDVIESSKIGLYALDGSSVIETDQFTGTYTIADIGKPVVADGAGGAAIGKVKVVAHNASATSRRIGTVYDVPSSVFVGQTATTVLPIKLNASPLATAALES